MKPEESNKLLKDRSGAKSAPLIPLEKEDCVLGSAIPVESSGLIGKASLPVKYTYLCC